MKAPPAKTVNRPAPVRAAAAPEAVQRRVSARARPGVQTALRVSSPRDPAEKEAEATARGVMRTALPESSVALVPGPRGGGVFRQVKPAPPEKEELRRAPVEKEKEGVLRAPVPEKERAGPEVRRAVKEREEPPAALRRAAEKEERKLARAVAEKEETKLARQPAAGERKPEVQRAWRSPYAARLPAAAERREETVQRRAEGVPDASSNVEAEIRASTSGGEPLPLSVRRFMEPRFGADFGGVRVHADERAASLNRGVAARAFAFGNHLFFGRDQYRPETEEGKELIAHELTHTIQQGASPQGGAAAGAAEVSQPAAAQVQRLGLSDALDYFADHANNIPGFRMFTIVLGANPINMSTVARTPANVLRAVVEFIPGGGLITRALDAHGVFDRVGNWVSERIHSLGLVGSSIRQAVMDFLHSLGWRDIFRLGDVWNRAKRIFTEPIERIKSFVRGLVDGILEIVKEVILRPLARLAEGTRGYDLLKAVLGRDPITGDPAPRNADTLIGGFMKLIGQEEVWENIKKANAVARAWAWFQGALGGVLGFVRQIPTLFLQALRSLGIADLVALPTAFARVVGIFTGAIGRFVSWAAGQVMQLLQLIFEVVAPGAMPYLRRAAGVFASIIRNPIGFVGNLVKAAKLGLQGFAARIGTHLKAGLIDWLTGSLPGIYIPKAFSLVEIVKFVFSVLGLTWANIRQKLVKAIGEPVVQGLEKAFDFVVALVTQGPAAAWEKIKEQLANLKDMVIGGITDFVVDMVAKKAIPKLVAMFIPGAGFVSAILSIYDTIMVFVSKLSKIAQVVTGFLGSIAAIASGALGAAAKKVEGILAGLLSLAISFLAGFAGLGKVSDKIMGVIQKVRKPIDKALDWLVNWIVGMAKKLFSKLFGKKKGEEGDTAESREVKRKVAAAVAGKEIKDASQAETLIAGIFQTYRGQGLKGIRLVYDPAKPGVAGIKVSASIAEVVASLPLTTIKEAGALKDFVYTFDFLAGGTKLWVYYDQGSKTYSGSPIENDPGGAHAEAKFASGHLRALRAQIAAHRAAGTLKTPPGQPVRVELNLNRITCPRCASIVSGLAASNPDMTFVVKAANVSNEVSFAVHAGYIADLIESGVIVEPLEVWPQIRKKFVEFQQKLKNGEVAFRGESGNFHAFLAAARRIEENLSKEQGVKEIIAEAKKILERRKKEQGTKKGLASVPPKGAGV